MNVGEKKKNKWINKPVNFNSEDPNEMELYRLAGTLPNFSHAVKDFLRTMRTPAAVSLPAYPLSHAEVPTETFTTFENLPPTGSTRNEDDQFLV